MSYKYHYTFDAATLLETCLAELQDVLRTSSAVGHRRCLTLFDLKTALSASEKLLLQHVQSLLEHERMYASPTLQELFVTGRTQASSTSSLSSVVGFLRMVVEHRQIESLRRTDRNDHSPSSTSADDYSESYWYYDPNHRNSSDKLLFSLIVALQLCFVRLDDARFVLTGRRRRHNDTRHPTPGHHQTKAITHYHHHHHTCVHTLVHACAYMGTLMYGTGFLASAQRLQVGHFWRIGNGNKSMWTAGSIGMAALTARWLRQTWNTWWMSSKIVDSTRALEQWNRKWHLMQAENNLLKQPHHHQQQPSYSNRKETTKEEQDKTTTTTTTTRATAAVKSERVIQYALNSKPQTLWHSQGEVRFLVLKRAMDAVYASMDLSSTTTTTNASAWFSKQLGLEHNWRLQLAEAAFYSSIGARHRAMEIAASSRSARELLHNLWGMKSPSPLPSSSVDNHTLSQRALQLLNQGAAAVADRVEIGGISCFVLSRDPVPEMASAIQSFHHRHGQRNSPVRTLSSIDEEKDGNRHATTSRAAPRRNSSRTQFEKRNVIFHLTGGGFFSHCIASDLPNLLHWSEVTGAVVICPEYGLLPEHTFPNALEHVERVYKTLLSSNDGGATGSSSPLGFEVNRLIVTGESAGGHLAVSLCSKLIMDSMASPNSLASATTECCRSLQGAPECQPRGEQVLPNALLCSCPLLDLSTDSQTNLVQGGGVVRAISDAYLPGASEQGIIDKKDPRVSPLYATNEVLRHFPPSLLLFAKQANMDKDEDAVVLFHRRLQTARVVEEGSRSELRAVAPHHLPNNYLGLGMTGFPQEGHPQFNHVSTWLCSQFDSSNAT